MLLNDVEEKKLIKFRNKHYKKHGNISKVTIKISATGIGDAKIVKCPYCKEEKDITDYKSW